MRGNGEECRVVNSTLCLDHNSASADESEPFNVSKREEYDCPRGREARDKIMVVNQPSSLERQQWTKRGSCIVE